MTLSNENVTCDRIFADCSNQLMLSPAQPRCADASLHKRGRNEVPDAKNMNVMLADRRELVTPPLS